jgi:hypothetical protein
MTMHLDLCFPAEWERIDPVRQAVGNCLTAVFGDRDLKDAIAMVSAELLENALKYGKVDQPDVKIRIHEDVDAEVMVIEVSNTIDVESSHLKTLEERVSWVKGFKDPQEAYLSALASAFQGNDDITSGLGLARISYEGGCEIECDTTSEPGRVIVRARYALKVS